MGFSAYEDYKDSEVEWLGEVPQHWGVRRLKYIVNLLTDKGDKQDNAIGLENIEGWTGKYIETEAEFLGNGVDFKGGDLLFGKLRPYLAKVWLAEFEGEAVGDFHVIRPSNESFGKFLVYQMLNRDFISIVDGSTFGAKMPRVSWDFMANLPIPVPQFDEQKAISSFLDMETSKIDALVSEQRRLIELLKEKRQAVISHAITKGLNPNAPIKPSGIKWLGDVPEHWIVTKMKFLGKAKIGLTYSPSDIVDEDEGALVLRSSNVQGGRIAFNDNVYVNCEIPDELRTREGDILICSRNGSRALIGKNAMIGPESVGQTYGAFMTVFRSPVNRYLFWVFNSQLFELQSASFLTATINQLTVGNLKSFDVLLPPEDEQKAISSFLDVETSKIDGLIAQAEQAIELLQERRTALISAAVTGKIDVRNYESLR